MNTSLLELDDQRVVAEISLANLRHNIRNIRQKLQAGVKLCAVVKADAYGHGAVAVARTCVEEGADFLAVACLSEAVELRESGISSPILILGPTPAARAPWLYRYNLSQTVSSRQDALALAQNLQASWQDLADLPSKHKIHLHLKLDTGMSRHGFYTAGPAERQQTKEEILTLQEELQAYPGMELEGMYTHFATNLRSDADYFTRQVQRFVDLVEALKVAACEIPIIHCCNSAATLLCPDLNFNMARAGIILYGAHDGDWMPEEIDLKYVMNFYGKLSAIREIKAGEGVSYGHIFVAPRDMRIGVLEAGYADGLNRLLSNQVKFQLGSTLVPQIGRICMDRCMLDLSDCPQAQVGDQVLIFGDSPQAELQVDYQAQQLGTISYELLCNVSPRVPRHYQD
ncbi:MAG: alanine racemase [Eubacteriales bacterium]|nr:alanine racemase [Eubacteriales bacterium]